MEGLMQYKFEKQNLSAAVSQTKLWRTEYKKAPPHETGYRDYILQNLNSTYRNVMLPCEPYLQNPALREKFGENYYKEKQLAEKILGL